MLIYITKRFEFDAAHRLPNHEGRCRNIHGHRYALEVTVGGKVSTQANASSEGMVMDFHDLKPVVKNSVVGAWDHALLLYKNDPILKNPEVFMDMRVVKTDYIPTAENMAFEAYEILKKKISEMSAPNSVTLVKVRLYETPTSWVDVGPEFKSV